MYAKSQPHRHKLCKHYLRPIRCTETWSRIVKSASFWVWVASARVWDPAAERFPASVRDIRKFGAQAKFLRRVHPSTMDGRSFIEVTMDKRHQGREVRDIDRFRDTKDGERFRDGRSSRDGF